MTDSNATHDWDEFLARYPNAHLLQTSAWGRLKASFGWQVEHVRAGQAGAQVLFRQLAPGLRLAYVPMGPIGPWCQELQPALLQTCRRRGVFALKIEPDAEESESLALELQAAGFRASAHWIQPRRSIVIDLAPDEDSILGAMKQKTRYNVRLASRKGVTVAPSDDLETFGALMAKTADRDGFGAHSTAYYRQAYDLFHSQGACELLLAQVEGTPLAALMVFARGARAWYFYGASTDLHRNLMPAYLLQWESMRWARSRGCTQYDLWGVPDADEETLESDFIDRTDGLWGVYRFKRGFGGRLIRSAGAWDYPLNVPLYALYRLFIRLRFGA